MRYLHGHVQTVRAWTCYNLVTPPSRLLGFIFLSKIQWHQALLPGEMNSFVDAPLTPLVLSVTAGARCEWWQPLPPRLQEMARPATHTDGRQPRHHTATWGKHCLVEFACKLRMLNKTLNVALADRNSAEGNVTLKRPLVTQTTLFGHHPHTHTNILRYMQ